jgi:hypothetical protein
VGSGEPLPGQPEHQAEPRDTRTNAGLAS